MTSAANARPFSVHARNIDSHHARTLSERSFEAAAVAYVEDYDPASGDLEVKVIVRDIATGREHCFCVDLDTGETTPCG